MMKKTRDARMLRVVVALKIFGILAGNARVEKKDSTAQTVEAAAMEHGQLEDTHRVRCTAILGGPAQTVEDLYTQYVGGELFSGYR